MENVKYKDIIVRVYCDEVDNKKFYNIYMFIGFANGKPKFIPLGPKKDLSKQEFAMYIQTLEKDL